MKIVLINMPLEDYSTFRPKDYNTVIPVGLGYLATILRKQKHEAILIDAEFERLSPAQINKRIRNIGPAIVGINIPFPNLSVAKRVVSAIDGVEKVIGGIQVTLEPRRCFHELKPDYMIVGEGEKAILYLVNNIGHVKKLRKVRGLYLKGDITDKSLFKKAACFLNLDRLPFLDRTLFKNEPFMTGHGLEMTLATSRGCPFNCLFCSVTKMFGNKVRYRSVDNVIKEIKFIKSEYSVSSVRFIDDDFLGNKQRILEFARKLIHQRIGIHWRALTRIEFLDKRMIPLLAESGCYRLAFGIETFNMKVQKSINKVNSLSFVKHIVTECSKQGIKTKGFFTIGYPGETRKQMEDTINKSRMIGFSYVNYNILRAFPGTELAYSMIKKGYDPKDLNEYHQFSTLDSAHGLSPAYKKRLESIRAAGINMNKNLKYHFSNTVPISGQSLEYMDRLVRKAYIDFYFHKVQDERGK